MKIMKNSAHLSGLAQAAKDMAAEESNHFQGDDVIFTDGKGNRVDIAECIRNMSSVEKARVRRECRRSFHKVDLYVKVQ